MANISTIEDVRERTNYLSLKYYNEKVLIDWFSCSGPSIVMGLKDFERFKCDDENHGR